jgi:hypothetical protein
MAVSNSASGVGTADPLASGVTRYISSVQPVHEAMNTILRQVAGLSLLIMSRRAAALAMDAPLVLAREAYRSASDALAVAFVPSQAWHHHHHMLGASLALRRVFDLVDVCLCLAADDADRADLVAALQHALHHLRAASRSLPGFEMVDLRQACCADASHAATHICS